MQLITGFIGFIVEADVLREDNSERWEKKNFF